jgi:hypothetical protein
MHTTIKEIASSVDHFRGSRLVQLSQFIYNMTASSLYLPINLQHYPWHIGLPTEAGTCAFGVSTICIFGDLLKANERFWPSLMIKVNETPIL